MGMKYFRLGVARDGHSWRLVAPWAGPLQDSKAQADSHGRITVVEDHDRPSGRVWISREPMGLELLADVASANQGLSRGR
jgi:hypothetical protein